MIQWEGGECRVAECGGGVGIAGGLLEIDKEKICEINKMVHFLKFTFILINELIKNQIKQTK